MLKKVRIALYDKEGYMPALAEYICKREMHLLEPRLFTGLPMLEKYIQENEVDVLLAGEEVREEAEAFRGKIGQVLFLSEQKQSTEKSDSAFLFKYQPASELVKDILAHIAASDAITSIKTAVIAKEMDYIGVYSPFGGGGVTSYAWKAARALASQYHTLYINLELFDGLDFLESQGNKDNACAHCGMSEVIFYMKQRREKLALKLESAVQEQEGLDILTAAEDYRDLYSLTEKDMQALLETLGAQTVYEKVVFDIGFFSEAVLYLLSQCSSIYLPAAKSETQHSKKRAFYRFLRRENCEQMMKSIQEF